MSNFVIGSLFSGIAGLENGLARGLGPGTRIAFQAEMDPFCKRLLRARFPGTRLLGSVQEVKRGKVEAINVLCGGFPCQPVSVAGARRGADDPRWLWPEFRRVIAELDPEWVVIENVPGLRTRGLDGVLADLAALGRDAEWFDLRASDVGAPHRRARLFIVAHRDGGRLDRFRVHLERAVADCRERTVLADAERRELQRRGGSGELVGETSGACDEGGERDQSFAASGDGSEALAHGHGHGRERERETRVHDLGALGDDAQRRDPGVAGDGGSVVADADGARPEGSGPERTREPDAGSRREGSGREPAIPHAESERRAERDARSLPERTRSGRAEPAERSARVDRRAFPPRPFDRSGWDAWIADGLPEPVIRGSVDGVPDRLDRLAALGNAVVEAVAEPIGIAIREASRWVAPFPYP